MKKIILIIAALIVFILPVRADTAEQARVIKADKNTHDLIIERSTGERLLIQHHYICNSMTTEFPVYLIWEGDKITRLKVDWNEICKVYDSGPYAGEITIDDRVKSGNLLEKEHIARITRDGGRYEIDYGEGCENLRDFVGKTAYISSSDLNGATLYLPEARGQCLIKSSKLLDSAESSGNKVESPIKNLQYKAENNEAYFYWDPYTGDKKWVYLISWSRFKLNPNDYSWNQMPFLKYTKENNYTAKTLMNNRAYYFYLSARDENGDVTPWTEVEVTPVLTAATYKNNPDPEEFKVTVTDNKSEYLLKWSDKSEKSKRYLIQFFVNGKRIFFKIISGQISQYTIPRKPEYAGADFRFTVRSISKNQYDATYYDGVYWEYK
jgi:hypothetical protein